MTPAEESEAIAEFREILRRCGDLCVYKSDRDAFYGKAELSDEAVLEIMGAVAAKLTDEEAEALRSIVELEPKGNA